MNLAFLTPAFPTTKFRLRSTRPTTHAVCCVTTSAGLLNSDDTIDSRFVDLRSIKTARWENAFVSRDPTKHPADESLDHELATIGEDKLFTTETIPLSQAEKSAVQALISRKSVLFYTNASESLKAFIMDLALRAKVWEQSVVYCASSKRSAQVFYSAISVQFSQPNEVVLDIGLPSLGTHELLHGSESSAVKLGNDPPCLIITVSEIATRSLMLGPKQSSISDASVFVLDSFIHNDNTWEELLLSIPSTASTCVIASDIDITIGEHILAWIHCSSFLQPCTATSR